MRIQRDRTQPGWVGTNTKTLPSLLKVFGCAELTAAKLIGETAVVSRFRSETAFARHAEVAPIPHRSGRKNVCSQVARSGNRQLNVALHRIGCLPHSRGDAFFQCLDLFGESHDVGEFGAGQFGH